MTSLFPKSQTEGDCNRDVPSVNLLLLTYITPQGRKSINMMSKRNGVSPILTWLLSLLVTCLVSLNAFAAPLTITFDDDHDALSEYSSLYRLQNHTFTYSNRWNIRVEEGFLVKDTDMMGVWKQVGETGKFHASSIQDPSVSHSVLLTAAMRIKTINDARFRFCRMSVSPESTMTKQVIAHVKYAETGLSLVNGEYVSSKQWYTKKVNLSEGGSFVELDLSSKSVYEVLVHTVDSNGLPVMMVVDQLVLGFDSSTACS